MTTIMVLLISSPKDKNTNAVIDWLARFNCDFMRVDLDTIDFNDIQITYLPRPKILLKLPGERMIDFDEVSYFFYRGSYLQARHSDVEVPEGVSSKEAVSHLQYESYTTTTYIYQQIAKRCIGLPHNKPLNKLKQLDYANQVGLKIPKSLVTGSKQELQDFFGSQSVITKAIQEAVFYQADDKICYSRTQKVDLEALENHFFPTMFQEAVEKHLEVRTFYLDGKTYSISMNYAQSNTSVDYRDHYHEMEYLPFTLPTEVDEKLHELMQKLHLISGSVDFILNKQGELLFLEVNTQGQYKWVSGYGGYQLDKEIATFLTSQEQNFQYHGN